MLKGKICIVTGSSAGIGASVALKFAKEQAEGLVLHGRQKDKLQSVKEQCVKAGLPENRIIIVDGNITEESVRERLRDETVKRFSRIDFLINNAGMFDSKPFMESELNAYDNIFDVNVRSVVALTKLCVPHLIATKGVVINVSATLAIRAQPWACFYNMSKAALDHFTKCLSLELAGHGVRVNSVNPGFVSGTEIITRTGAPPEMTNMVEEQSKKSHPLHRCGTCDEVAEAVFWLCSKGTFTTGLCLTVDGGFSVA